MENMKELDELNIDEMYEDTFQKDRIDKILDAVSKMDTVIEKLDIIEKTITSKKEVNKDGSHRKKAGRKPCQMFYEDNEITKDELLHLRKMGVTIPQILDSFKYINERNEWVRDRNKCRGYLTNILYK